MSDFLAALEATSGQPARVDALLQKGVADIVIENGRLYAPHWDEAYVDLPAILAPNALEGLRSSRMIAFADDRVAAFAAKVADLPCLFVSAGLIELLGFCASHVTVCGRLAVALDRDLIVVEELFLQIVANFVENGWPLCDEVEASSFESYRNMAINRDCMFLFVLLHELGHVRCGHLDGRWLGAADFQTIFPDLNTSAHGREIEADRFACEAFSDPNALHVASTFFSIWARVQVSRRVRLGIDALTSRTHPLAMNRLHRVHLTMLARGSSTDGSRIEGLHADIARCAEMVTDPASFGLYAERYSPLEGRKRHQHLVSRYAAMTAQLR